MTKEIVIYEKMMKSKCIEESQTVCCCLIDSRESCSTDPKKLLFDQQPLVRFEDFLKSLFLKIIRVEINQRSPSLIAKQSTHF